MTNLEARTKRLEDELEDARRLIRELQTEVGKIRQDQFAASPAGGGGGGGAGVFFCLPTSLGGATGSWPTLTPGSQSLTVYQVVGGALSSIGTATVKNFYPAATVASKVLEVTPNGDGTYSAVAQSCT
jgi:hypothetical protein